jgi:hypothetical protein
VKHSETPRELILPRLNLKGPEKRIAIPGKFMMSEDFSSKAGGTGIIIHEMKMKGDDSVGFFQLGGG